MAACRDLPSAKAGEVVEKIYRERKEKLEPMREVCSALFLNI
jgi:hypothetical protein